MQTHPHPFISWDALVRVTGAQILSAPPSNGCLNITDDSRIIKPGSLFVAIPGEICDGHNFLQQAHTSGADAILVQHLGDRDKNLINQLGIFVVPDTLKAFQQLAAYHRTQFQFPVIAVTGSCGKTSCKEMCASILNVFSQNKCIKTEGNTNNHFGVPRNLFRLTEQTAFAVIEAGTNHPGEIRNLADMIRPTSALITCIAPAHLEAFGTLEGIANEKSTVFDHLPENGCAIYPAGTPYTPIFKQHAGKAHCITFGLSPEADIQAVYQGAVADGYGLTIINHLTNTHFHLVWNLGGEAQASNAAAATAMAFFHNIPEEAIAEGLKTCQLPGNRMKIRTFKKCHLVNDAYNANPASVQSSLTWFAEITKKEKERLVILGDMLELGTNELQLHQDTLHNALKFFREDEIRLLGPRYAQVAGNVTCYASLQELQDSLEIKDNTWILIKASNSMKLYKLEEFLENSDLA